MKNFLFKLTVFVSGIIVLFFLTGCDNTKRFNKSVAKDPSLLSTACKETYPCLPSEIKSDTVTMYDTLIPEVQIRTEIIKDTVREIRNISKVITKTVRIRDTIRIIDRAALVTAERERGRVTDLMTEFKEESDKWKRIARIRLWWIIGLSAFIGIGVTYKIKTLIK